MGAEEQFDWPFLHHINTLQKQNGSSPLSFRPHVFGLLSGRVMVFGYQALGCWYFYLNAFILDCIDDGLFSRACFDINWCYNLDISLHLWQLNGILAGHELQSLMTKLFMVKEHSLSWCSRFHLTPVLQDIFKSSLTKLQMVSALWPTSVQANPSYRKTPLSQDAAQ